MTGACNYGIWRGAEGSAGGRCYVRSSLASFPCPSGTRMCDLYSNMEVIHRLPPWDCVTGLWDMPAAIMLVSPCRISLHCLRIQWRTLCISVVISHFLFAWGAWVQVRYCSSDTWEFCISVVRIKVHDVTSVQHVLLHIQASADKFWSLMRFIFMNSTC